MSKAFTQDKNHNTFYWMNFGNIQDGREILGEEMPVIVYRMMQFAMRDVMTKEFGREKADCFLRESGFLAGKEFAKNALDLNLGFNDFIVSLHNTLLNFKIGILRMEYASDDAGEIIFSIEEDLDCSGLPVTNETVCNYDEGFIAGILEAYTGKPYKVLEIDCWVSGGRVCRFKCTVGER
ncbi:MAG: 4-vinyl reductase [Treponema sp.]|nr:4-vinyl reductase [Treponema sp.]